MPAGVVEAGKGVRRAPLLEGARASEAWAAVRAVARDLSRAEVIEELPAGVALGSAGLALFFAGLAEAEAEPGREWEERAVEHLARAVAGLREGVVRPSLFEGFTGVGWALDHLRGRVFDAPGDLNAELDAGLLGALDRGLERGWTSDCDLIGGLVGFGVYAAGRLGRPSGHFLLGRVVRLLDASKVALDGGWAWHTAPELLPAWQRALSPGGYCNLGLAHGVPGVAALLAIACEQGVEAEAARPLLEGAVRWILAQRLPEGRGACFPNRVPEWPEGPGSGPSRLAWCYGDLGLCVALLGAARRLGRADWEAAARAVARAAARRPRMLAGVKDPGLCHGAAGNAHLFLRLYRATGEPVFREAALGWYDEVLAFRVPDAGVGGFRAWSPARAEAGLDPWESKPGFLDGGAGVGLALLAGLGGDPAWDRVLLAS